MLETMPPIPRYDGKPVDCLYCVNKTTHPSCICYECRNRFADYAGENLDY
jgi:hypothetical protein